MASATPTPTHARTEPARKHRPRERRTRAPSRAAPLAPTPPPKLRTARVAARADARDPLAKAGLALGALVVASVTPRDAPLAQAGLAFGALVVASVALLVLLRAIALGQGLQLLHRVADDPSDGGLHIERPRDGAEDRTRTAIETGELPPWSQWDEPPDETLDNREP